MNFIELDNQPFTVVEDHGFIELIAHLKPRYLLPSRKYFAETMLLEMYEKLRSTVSKELDEACRISFTTDIWAASHSN